MVQNIHVCLVALWPSVVHFQLELVERAVQRVFSIKELGKVVFSRNTFLNALNTKLVYNVVRLAPVNSSVDIRRAPWRRVTMASRSVMLVTCALAVQWSIKFWWKYFYSSCLVLSQWKYFLNEGHQWSTVENISTMMILNKVPKIFRKWWPSINSRLKHLYNDDHI